MTYHALTLLAATALPPVITSTNYPSCPPPATGNMSKRTSGRAKKAPQHFDAEVFVGSYERNKNTKTGLEMMTAVQGKKVKFVIFLVVSRHLSPLYPQAEIHEKRAEKRSSPKKKVSC